MSAIGNPAKKRHPDVFQEYGWVAQEDSQGFHVDTAQGRVTAGRAVGCLIRPGPGDRVLLSCDESGEYFILNILERSGSSETELVLEGDTRLTLAHGRLTLALQNGLDVMTPDKVRMTARDLEVQAMNGDVAIDRLGFFGRLLNAHVDKAEVAAGTLDRICERMVTRVKRSYRIVAEMEHTRAGRLICEVKNMLALRGKYAVITAKEDVKIDGEQIHLG
jgi:hypothetical protein